MLFSATAATEPSSPSPPRPTFPHAFAKTHHSPGISPQMDVLILVKERNNEVSHSVSLTVWQVPCQALDLSDLIHFQNNTMRKLMIVVPVLVMRKLKCEKRSLAQGLDVEESELILSPLTPELHCSPSTRPPLSSTLNKLLRVEKRPPQNLFAMF